MIGSRHDKPMYKSAVERHIFVDMKIQLFVLPSLEYFMRCREYPKARFMA